MCQGAHQSSLTDAGPCPLCLTSNQLPHRSETTLCATTGSPAASLSQGTGPPSSWLLHFALFLRAGWRSGYLATAANAVDHPVERRVLLVDWILRIHQALLRGHLIGARLATPSPQCLRQRLLV